MLDPDPRLLHLTGCLVFLLLPATAASLIQRGWDARRLGEKGLAAWTLLEILGRNRPTTAQIDAAQMRHSPNQGSSASLLYAAAGIVLAVPLRGHVPPGPWVAVLDGVLTLSGLVLVTALLRRLARGLKSGTGDLDPRILRVWRHWIQGLEDQMPPG